jgi:ribulose kinase
MNEGGQSSTGQLIDFVMSTHPAYPKLLAEAEKTGKNPFTLLGERLDRMRIEKGLETASSSRLFDSYNGRLTDSSIDQGSSFLS